MALSRVPRTTPTVATALASMPAETVTASVTDWRGARTMLDAEGAALLDRAYETDLSAVSVLGDMAPVMRGPYGWTVLDAQWEGLAQSRQGAAIVVQMPPGFDLDVVRDGLAEAGYTEPFDSDGVWRGGADLVARIDGSLTPLMAHAAVLDDSRRVVFSDNAPYVSRTVEVIEGSRPALAQDESVDAVGDRIEGAAATVLHVGRRGCQVMGFGSTSPDDQALARQRLAAVGGVTRHQSVALALMPGLSGGASRSPLLVAMHFDDTSALAGEGERRAALAVGDAPGQGDTYGSRFSVASSVQRGGDVVLRLRPREPDAQLLSDLNFGALLFAACP